jgi:type IV fimbrial biogenesis protein FimT
MRRGTTLLELLLALTMLGILLAIGATRVAAVVDAARVRVVTAQLVGAIEAARGSAIRLGGNVTLHLDDARWQVRRPLGADTIIVWQLPGHQHAGVTLSGAGAPIRFGPAGLATGVANRTFQLSRGVVTRSVVLSRLGRVR